MAIQSFKNVGVREFQTFNVLTTPASATPIGVKTPLALGENDQGLFEMHTDIKNVVHDNLKNLILTNHGERLIQYELGANIRPLATEYTSKDDFDNEAKIRIKSTVSKWMPFVDLIGFDSRPEFINNKTVANIAILVVYSVPQLGILEKALDIIISVI